MRIDNLGFLLKVECFFMVFDLGLFDCVSEVLFVVGEDILWVWVSHESICAARLSVLWVTGGNIINYRKTDK